MKKSEQAKQALARLRKEVDLKKYPEIGRIADSLEKLMDGASKGGVNRAKKLSKKRRSEIASAAAKARWSHKGKAK